MNVCRACNRHDQNYLCTDCETLLADMLADIPWLLDELDARIQKLDRVGLGTIGRNRRPDEMNVMDFDAAETARDVRTILHGWVCTVTQQHSGRIPPALNTVSTRDLARWLQANVTAIARLAIAGKFYADINRLVSTTQQGGTLHRAINATEKHAAGPCPTILGKNRDGTPRQCGEMLFADTYDRTTSCPKCGHDVDVEANRLKAAADRDLHTRADIVEVLANIDEPVTTEQINQWIRSKRLRPLAYRQGGAFRLNDHDEPLYSIERARKLRRRDMNLRTRARRWANA